MVKAKRKTGQRYLGLAVTALLVVSGLLYAGHVYQEYIRVQSSRIGVIRVTGSINDFHRYLEQARAAREDPRIKAVVVVVDSPGGTVQACFQTESAFRELKAQKPVVVTMGRYALSGAYLVSTASHHIFAHEYTITAGLGVVAVWVSHENRLRKEGIDYYVWRSGEHKDLGAEYRAPTEEESRYMQSLVDNLMRDMVTRIKANRPAVENTIDELMGGLTLWGREALPRKLVDTIGGYEDALRKAEELAGLKKGSYIIVELGS